MRTIVFLLLSAFYAAAARADLLPCSDHVGRPKLFTTLIGREPSDGQLKALIEHYKAVGRQLHWTAQATHAGKLTEAQSDAQDIVNTELNVYGAAIRGWLSLAVAATHPEMNAEAERALEMYEWLETRRLITPPL